MPLSQRTVLSLPRDASLVASCVHVQRQEENASRGKSARGVAKRRAWADEAVHVTANKIVELAVEQNARVVVEDLSPLSAIRRRTRIKGSRRGGFNRLLNRVQYEKLKSVLLYKLGEYGLPKPVEVRAAYTSITCPECGHVSKAHRLKIAADDGFEMEEFNCVECGQARVPPCRWRGHHVGAGKDSRWTLVAGREANATTSCRQWNLPARLKPLIAMGRHTALLQAGRLPLATTASSGICPGTETYLMRRFPPPCAVEKITGGLVVRDANGQALARVPSGFGGLRQVWFRISPSGPYVGLST
jgi:IS605 OrfB family transposase